MFIEDSAILSMIHTRASRPDAYVIGANVVNQPLSSWLHRSLGAVKPHLPDTDSHELYHYEELVSWRTSLLPSWKGSSAEFDVDSWIPPSNRKHRWLPIRGKTDHVLDHTPIMQAEYDAYTGLGWQKWSIAAQQHYSLFENLEAGEMWRYRFGMWDYRDLRMGLQFVVMTGKDINIAKPIDADDEGHFAVTMPRLLGRC